MLVLSGTQTKPPRHTLLSAHSCPKPKSCRSPPPPSLGGLTMKIFCKAVTLGLLSVLTVSGLLGAARADVVLDWNAIAVDTAVGNKQDPYGQARDTAIRHVTIFETRQSMCPRYKRVLRATTFP